MKKRVVACTMAGLLGLVLAGASWSCGCTRTVCHAKPVCHTVKTVEVVKVRPACGCNTGGYYNSGYYGGGGGYYNSGYYGGGGGLFW